MTKIKRSLSASAMVWAMRIGTLVVALTGAWILFFANPINWKLYSQMRTVDWGWAWLSNILTIGVALALWWWVQRFLTRRVDRKREPNQPPVHNALDPQ